MNDSPAFYLDALDFTLTDIYSRNTTVRNALYRLGIRVVLVQQKVIKIKVEHHSIDKYTFSLNFDL